MQGKLSELKRALFTALVCFLALQLIMTVITPLLPWIITGLLLVTIVGFVYYRRMKL